MPYINKSPFTKKKEKKQGVTGITFLTFVFYVKSYGYYSGYSLYLWWVLDSEYFGKFVRILFHYFVI